MLRDTIRLWQPFQLQALGVVLLLGSDEVNLSLGRLAAYSSFLQWLPLPGFLAILSHEFLQPEAGYTLYDITHGAKTTNLSPWLTRWARSQKLTADQSIVTWSVVPLRGWTWKQIGSVYLAAT